MNAQHRPTIVTEMLPWLLALAAAAGSVAPGTARAATSWESDPYRVRCVLLVPWRPQNPWPAEQYLRRGLLQQADAVVGAAWQLEVVPAQDALQTLAPEQELPWDRLPGIWDEQDKIFLLGLSWQPGGYRLWCREVDVLSRRWGPVRRAQCPSLRLLPRTAFDLLVRCFRPLTRIDTAKRKTALVQLRAGTRPWRDPAADPLGPGALLLPVIRYDDRDGNPRQIRVVPWTCLRVQRREGPLAHCQVFSGLRSPLSRRRRGRTHMIAMLVRPLPRRTVLQVVSNDRFRTPLEGYEVLAYGPDDPKTTTLGWTDHRGQLELPPGDRLRLLLIRSGYQVLARIPLVPGLEARIEAPVPNDDQRLTTESFLIALQQEVIDVVIQRQILIRRIEKRLAQGDVKTAEALLQRLIRLPGRDEFESRINRHRQSLDTTDRWLQARTDRLFRDTLTLVARYLDVRPVELAEQAVRRAKGGSGR